MEQDAFINKIKYKYKPQKTSTFSVHFRKQDSEGNNTIRHNTGMISLLQIVTL